MPRFVTFDNFTARPTIRAGGVENGYRLKDVIITSFDNDDLTSTFESIQKARQSFIRRFSLKPMGS